MSIPPCPSPFNLAAYVLDGSGAARSKIALEIITPDTTHTYTYGDLRASVTGIANGFRARGLPNGARILLRLGNTIDFPLAFLGAIHAGLIPVPTSPELSQPEIDSIAAQIRPALIVAADGIICPDGATITTTDLHAMTHLPPRAPELGDPNRLAYILYTSGTSGHPRAVMHAHRAVWARRHMWRDWVDLRASDRMLHAGAFNWSFTLGTGLLDPWAIGATALIPQNIPLQDLGPHIAAHRATIFAAAPGLYRHVLKRALPPMPALRHGLSAGEKMPDTIRAAWQNQTKTPIHEAFGMSECSTFISSSPLRPAPDNALGYVQTGRNIALLNDGKPADEGTIAIHKSDAGLMLGYLDQPLETAAKFEGDWFVTGDLARREIGGAITYLGRGDDMINAGGVRVSPLEIEAKLACHPRITEVAAVEISPKTDVTIIAAFYTAKDVIEQDELAQFGAKHLARYKIPRLFERVEALPRGNNNKLLRRVLRDNWEAQNGQT